MSQTDGLGTRALRAVSWTLVGNVASNVIRIVVVAALGRLLTPAEFGAIAASMTLIQLARIFRLLGVGHALVQRETIEPGHVESATTFSVLLGIGMCALVFALAPLVGDFYRIPELAPIVRGMSLMFAIRSLSTVAAALCQRDMQFRTLAMVDLVAYACGSAAAIGFAAGGLGAWSMVYGYLIEASLITILLLAVRRPPLGLRARWVYLRDLLRFGVGMTVTQVSMLFAQQIDNVVVGRALGKTALGFYSRAYELVTYPAATFQSVAGTVLFSAFSRIQDDAERLGRAFRGGLFVNAIVLLPASTGLIVLAPEFIELLMGEGWDAAVLPFRIMAVSMLFRVSYRLSHIIAMSSGRLFALAMWQLVYGGMVLVGALIGVRWGIAGVACGTAIAIGVNFVTVSRLGLARTTLGWRGLVAAHGQGALAALTALAGAWPVAHLLRQTSASPAVIIAAAAAAGSIGFVLLLWRGVRDPASDWSWAWGMARGLIGKKRGRGTRAPAVDPS